MCTDEETITKTKGKLLRHKNSREKWKAYFNFKSPAVV